MKRTIKARDCFVRNVKMTTVTIMAATTGKVLTSYPVKGTTNKMKEVMKYMKENPKTDVYATVESVEGKYGIPMDKFVECSYPVDAEGNIVIDESAEDESAEDESAEDESAEDEAEDKEEFKAGIESEDKAVK